MLAGLTSTYPSYKSLKDVKLSLCSENALEKRYSQKTFFLKAAPEVCGK